MKNSFNKLTAVCLCALVIVSSCSNNDSQTISTPAATTPADPYHAANQKIKEGFTLLRDGDLVVRNGQEFSSQVFRQLNKTDKKYSHAGIVLMENGYPMIYHVITGDENPDSKFRKDSLSFFTNPRKNFGFAIYRYQLDTTERKHFREIVLDLYSKGVRFDSLLNMATDDRMYCSELIYKAMKKATDGRVTFNLSEPTVPESHLLAKYMKLPVEKIIGQKGVAIDNLYLHPACQLIKAYDYTDTTRVPQPVQ